MKKYIRSNINSSLAERKQRAYDSKDADELDRLADDRSAYVLNEVIRNSSTSAKTIDKLAHRKLPDWLRYSLPHAQNISDDTLIYLLDDTTKSSAVSWTVGDVAKEVYDYRQSNTKASDASYSLDDLVEDMWYQTVQNYKDDTYLEDMIDIAVDHVITYIKEMDDDRDFAEYLLEVDTPEFDKRVRRMCQKLARYVN